MKARFIKKEPVNSTVTTFYFEPLEPIHYIAGQFTELRLPHESADDRKDKRWFTLSSAPTDTLLSLTTRLNNSGSTFKNKLVNLKPGTEVSLAAPMGDFVLPKLASVPLVFVAIGIGITPYRSIIAELQATGEQRDIQLIHSVRSLDDTMFGEIFQQLEDRFYLTPEDSAPLTGELIMKLTKPTSKHYIYVAGPEQIVERIIAELEDEGISRRHMYTDFFQGY